MAKRKLSPNAQRRAAQRAREKIADASEKLAKLERGGSPERPIELESASLVEPHARLPCVRCGQEVRVIEHEAKTIGERRLRVVKTKCTRCGAIRVLYMRITTPLSS
ncbi:MAG: hypothetical protein ACRELY_25800 [Polyangiaceae bacterium]